MANRKITDVVLNGRRLLSGEAVRRVLFNGQVIWPFIEGQVAPTIQRVVYNGEVLYDRRSLPYLDIYKLIVYVSQDPLEESKNMVFTNTEFTVE